jgi:hypothetical protein
VIVARNAFFSFDYDDIMAVNVVRNSNVVRAVNEQLPFRDKSLYEEAKKTQGAIKRAIDNALSGSSVTIILNGTTTAYSDWVRYEIAKSFEKGNGFVVIDINGIGPNSLLTGPPQSPAGPNPLSKVGGVCAANSNTIKVYEHNGTQWVPFAMLREFSNADAKYPRTIIEGNFNLQQRFALRKHWKIVKANFIDWIEAAAKDAGWPPTT